MALDKLDGQIDENVRSTFYEDNDGDGFGETNSIDACALPKVTCHLAMTVMMMTPTSL